MPNTGKPSQDCHLCRQRRVKCDLGRPGCQRCVKYGVECTGYRDQTELVFRNANPSTVKKRKKRTAKRDDAEANAASSSHSSGSTTPAASTHGELSSPPIFSHSTDLIPNPKRPDSLWVTLPPSLSEHWTSHSVPILLNVYSTLDFLNNAYRANPRDGPLVWAAHLFSRTYVTNIRYPTSMHKDSEAETQRELGTYLGRTLSSVGAALKSSQGAFRDDVLATVWILANYELLVGSLSRMEPLSPWHLHARGLYSLLKARGNALLYSDAGRTAFWPCYNMVQIQALVSNTECPPESDEWLGIIRNNLQDGEAYSLHVSIFITKCAHVQARILAILRLCDFRAAESEYQTLVSQFTEAEEELDEHLAASNRYSHDLDSYMNNLYSSAIVKGYHYIQLLANFLTHYPASKLSLEDLGAQRARCLQKTRRAAQDIINSVPWILGPLACGKDKSPKVLFDAMKMIWPLTSVYVLSTTLPEQKSEAEAALIFIGKEIGVRQALNTYPGRFPLPLEAEQPLGVVGPDSSPWAEEVG
ncbi:hypothetical protein TOPH_05164 [Tolypocladium ophioglossoides CBS 100239]|uniref:Zn(2)-C6 fungal-type domain-containing protein n=1 Tax=Tolypocladium ophioglossoides (strain CBS 100239) TaxID=1163406 RepID=A0A0L0N816_TOLOC|nr:hypothetical protein TOPH_05164 [Tolypocladium ophioglossoides CBS 100239]